MGSIDECMMGEMTARWRDGWDEEEEGVLKKLTTLVGWRLPSSMDRMVEMTHDPSRSDRRLLMLQCIALEEAALLLLSINIKCCNVYSTVELLRQHYHYSTCLELPSFSNV